jgi:hypothetical protein
VFYKLPLGFSARLTCRQSCDCEEIRTLRSTSCTGSKKSTTVTERDRSDVGGKREGTLQLAGLPAVFRAGTAHDPANTRCQNAGRPEFLEIGKRPLHGDLSRLDGASERVGALIFWQVAA